MRGFQLIRVVFFLGLGIVVYFDLCSTPPMAREDLARQLNTRVRGEVADVAERTIRDNPELFPRHRFSRLFGRTS